MDYHHTLRFSSLVSEKSSGILGRFISVVRACLWSLSLFCGYYFLRPFLLFPPYFLCFMSLVRITGSYTEDESGTADHTGCRGLWKTRGLLWIRIFKASFRAKTLHEVTIYFYNLQNTTHSVIGHCLYEDRHIIDVTNKFFSFLVSCPTWLESVTTLRRRDLWNCWRVSFHVFWIVQVKV